MTSSKKNFSENADSSTTEQEYAMILDPRAVARNGYIVATLHDGRDIEYTDFVPVNTIPFLENNNPLAKIEPAAIVRESDIKSRDYTNRTDLSNDPDLRRKVFDAIEAAKAQFKPPKR